MSTFLSDVLPKTTKEVIQLISKRFKNFIINNDNSISNQHFKFTICYTSNPSLYDVILIYKSPYYKELTLRSVLCDSVIALNGIIDNIICLIDIEKELIEALYKVGFQRQNLDNPILKRDRIKLYLIYYSAGISINVYYLGEHDNWKKYGRYTTINWKISRIIEAIDELKPKPRLTKIPIPSEFKGDEFKAEGKAYIHNNLIHAVHIIGIRKVLDNLLISTDIAEPDNKFLWYLCLCSLNTYTTFSGATLRILTNGEVYHLVHGYTKFKIASEKPFKENLTLNDKKLINYAISKFKGDILS